uniref:DUF1768 domain-containing protein n=1 Tax=Rhabditophanes sp. KR3021 TaxID=114890 RepID=A0AC35TMG4_9BILA
MGNSTTFDIELNTDGKTFICFEYSKNCVFSNRYLSSFTIRNRKFNCSEQYFMFAKAQRFKDGDAAKAILQESNPIKQKEIGRSIKNFNKPIWDRESYKFMKRAVQAKFSQNAELRPILLSTNDATLVGCASRDVIWGIGCEITNPTRLDKKSWKGQNRLGQALMEVRSLMCNRT